MRFARSIPAPTPDRPPAGAPATSESAAAPCTAAELRDLHDRFGFHSVSCLRVTGDRESQVVEMLWTTAGDRWRIRYRDAGLGMTDFRIALPRSSIAPWMWMACSAGSSIATRHFLAAAAPFGIGSGVVAPLHLGGSVRVVLTFDAPLVRPTPAQRSAITTALGDLLLFAIRAHERLLVRRVDTARSRSRRDTDNPALTDRERQCLALAAHGYTSADIGERLDVSERTINFHFNNLRLKLGAMNRPEAIAKGMALGVVRVG